MSTYMKMKTNLLYDSISLHLSSQFLNVLNSQPSLYIAQLTIKFIVYLTREAYQEIEEENTHNNSKYNPYDV